MTQRIPTPLPQNGRIQFMDAIRGMAVLGILIMNSMGQGQASFYSSLDPRQSVAGANYWAWLIESLFFEDSMRWLFSILFGAGTILFLLRLQKQKNGLEPADIYYRRLLWLLMFGLLNGFIFLWPGDILFAYAICGLLLFPFRNWSPRKLLWAALFFLAIATYRENTGLYDSKELIAKGGSAALLNAKKIALTPLQKEELDQYTSFKEKSGRDGIIKDVVAKEKKVQGQSYLAIFRQFKEVNMRVEKYVYSGLWDSLIFFFMGMAFYKSGFLLGEKSIRFYVITAVVGIGIGLLLNYFWVQLRYDLHFDKFLYAQQWKFDYYEIRRVFQTTGYLSALILLYKIVSFRKLMNLFAPIGQMAFTNYLSQSILTSIIFFGFHLYARLQRYEIYYVVGAIWIFQIITSHVWLRYFKFGPFEWLWRSLTYWHRQPIKKPILSDQEEQPSEAVPALV
jgi:uncharacterized protein